FFKPGNQPTVCGAVLAGRGVNTGIPKLAEGPFLVATVAVGVNQAASNSLLTTLIAVTVGRAIALSGLTDLLVAFMGGGAPFYSHDLGSQFPFDVLSVAAF